MKYTEEQGFKPVYVLKEIACQLYPYLYQVENALRGYLIKFMTTRVGAGWWDITVSQEIALKAKGRRHNEVDFGKHMERDTYLIDFGELGRIIYEWSSGFGTSQDIVKRVNETEETEEGVGKLKEQLRPNYHKFFKEAFANHDFKAKWTYFEKLRNNIAHGNLFTGDDLKNGIEIARQIAEIVDKASGEIDKLVITAAEGEAIRETAFSTGFVAKSLSEQDLLYHLANQEDYFHPSGAYVGLTHFKNFLAGLGYAYQDSGDLIRQLDADKKLDVYDVDDRRQSKIKVKAVRLAKAAAD